MRSAERTLLKIYGRLYRAFGPQYWWPAASPFEVMIGAILTQNTSWSNVEKAVAALKRNSLLSPNKLYSANRGKIARLIKPVGYYNIKAKRLKNFLNFIFENYNGKINEMTAQKQGVLRKQLLNTNGVGPETADSILLYAANKPTFVVDAYTRRILLRHSLIEPGFNYDRIQHFFMANLPHSAKLFNEYHALFVRLGKSYCKKQRFSCDGCPIKDIK